MIKLIQASAKSRKKQIKSVVGDFHNPSVFNAIVNANNKAKRFRSK